ncbi:TetR family transcriptional regulator [Gemmatimonadetes bacterium T265]|nr:TetR family transcriptional regulator [Gemmatimonadetes bacterium T265]
MVYPAKLSRGAVVDAALALVEREGRPALGMRAVAGALGVRPASLYKHVGDLAGLEALVAECAAAGLAAEIDAALARVPAERSGDPAAALRATADVYVRFARGRPALYALLADAAVQARPGEERKALWNRLLAVVGALTGDADDTGGAVAVWAFLHGFVALGAAGLYGASGPRDGFARGVAALAAGLPDSAVRARHSK